MLVKTHKGGDKHYPSEDPAINVRSTVQRVVLIAHPEKRKTLISKSAEASKMIPSNCS